MSLSVQLLVSLLGDGLRCISVLSRGVIYFHSLTYGRKELPEKTKCFCTLINITACRRAPALIVTRFGNITYKTCVYIFQTRVTNHQITQVLSQSESTYCDQEYSIRVRMATAHISSEHVSGFSMRYPRLRSLTRFLLLSPG